jgi:PKD repeat protein
VRKMMKKIFIAGLILCSFLVVSISPVIAIDETHNITDAKGDVADESGNVVSSSPDVIVDNIDIREMTYSREGKNVILTLKVYGNIEDKGNINDIESGEGIEYDIYLYTSNDSYTINYVNNNCKLLYESTGEEKNISDFSVVGSTLTVPFDLLSSDETYDSIYSMAFYYKISGTDYEYIYDAAPELTNLEVTINAPSTGKVDESIHFSGEANNGTSPYNWSWDFGDGGTAYTQNAIHTFNAAGTYEVILSVTDTNGDQGTASANVIVSESGTSDGGNNGGNTNSESSNSGLILFVVIIAIIIIVGIAIVVYVIRR